MSSFYGGREICSQWEGNEFLYTIYMNVNILKFFTKTF